MRSIVLAEVPTAAPTRRRPFLSLAELGYWMLFSMSLIVMSPFKYPSLSTMGSFSMR